MISLVVISLVAAQVDNAWWYVTAAYLIIFGGMVVFIVSMAVRTRRARRELDQLS